MAIAFESIVPSAGDATDRITVRRGAGPADHTMELLTAAALKGLMVIVPADVLGFDEAVDDRVASLLVAGANITFTYNDVANTLTIAAAGGGGSGDVVGPGSATDNALARFDTTTGKLIQNSAVTLDDNGGMTFPAIAIPAAPAAGNLTLFARDVGGRVLPASIGPSGLDSPLQPHIALNKRIEAIPAGDGTGITYIGWATPTILGGSVATTKATTTATLYGLMRGLEWLIGTAAATAIAGFRGAARQFSIGGAAADFGGFHFVERWGPATGVATATTRAFVGLVASTTNATDAAEPSARVNQVGMGWDAADTNIQFMHNDGTGACTKIDLGSSFPKPTVDRQEVYELVMFSKPGTTGEVKYRVRNLRTNVEATGTVTTDIPSTTTLLNPYSQISVGGTSSVIGICLFSLYVETDY